jgi:energy-coupling factor transport system ATP-binding protein
VVALGELAGWSPLPLSVRDARRRAAPLRERLASAAPPPVAAPATGVPVARAERLTVRRGPLPAVRALSLALHAGEVTALMGRNGAGKSTLLGALAGLYAPVSGRVEVGGLTPHRARPRDLVRQVALVPQDPRDLLGAETVAAECAAADQDAGAEPGSCRALLDRLAPGLPDGGHPRDLSEGQRLTLALAVVLTGGPALLLLDEPTRGLDYAAKARLVAILTGLAEAGTAILLATHDVELAAELAHRTLVLADGELVADGPSAEVVTASPVYAPQVAKVLAPQPWLTVRQVAAALAEVPAR